MVIVTELSQESSSSSSSTHDQTYRYDVFLSFRGVDTRNGFTDHLYNTLLDAGINTFLDDEEIETGEPLKPELEDAIQSSRASIIVLSKNYASSSWCLDELVLILEQKRKFKQIVIPIFYHVEPTDVRKQQNNIGEAIAEHKQKMDAETNAEKRSQLAQKMESWKMALTKIADLKGLDAKGRKETEFIKEVVADIHRRLRVPLSNTLPCLIGMDYEIEYVSSWLTDGSYHTADILTVVGMSGIGKTSLARHVFWLHSNQFDKSSFIEGINRKDNEQFNGLLYLQKQLHRDVTKKMELQVNDVTMYTSMIENVLARKRVLIVLDDIGSLIQLDALLGDKGLHPGSKVIITTKDASLTKKCALFKSQGYHNHKEVLLNGLFEFESLKLLCIHAFNSQNPKEGYEEVLENLVKYCDGHPLAIEVLGRSLQDQDVEIWIECIEVLKECPHSDINSKLKMSFDALQFKNDKKLFKHIACFFVGMDRDVTETILDACGIKTKAGMRNLLDKSLLSIDWESKLVMHSLIQEMGRDLVRQESLEKPWKRSRLWCHEESFKVLKQKKGKGNLLGLSLDMRMLDKKKLCELKTESFSQMDNLMLLQLNYVQLNGCFRNFPEELRWLCMQGSPLKSIPLDLPIENLVALDMSYCNIESFDMSYSNPQPHAKRQEQLVGSSSKDKRLLRSLKILDLSFCEQLHSIGGFFLLTALERLILKKCTGLTEVCESIGQCDELAHIDLSCCYKLSKLPKSIGKLKKVKTLLLDGCNSCESEIKIGNVKAIPSILKFSMICLPSSLRILSLTNNNLSNECFPMDLSSLAMLEELHLDCNPVVSMPNCVRTLPNLQKLSMNNCDKLISIEHPPRTLRYLFVSSTRIYNPSIRKIKFDPEMSPLILERIYPYMYQLIVEGVHPLLSSIEIDGMLKIQGMASVEEKVLHSLDWKNFDCLKKSRLKIRDFTRDDPIESETQMYYQFGIFSTFYEGKEIPDWISCRSEGSSISFTIPSSSNNLRGMNFCCLKSSYSENGTFLPMIKISNITQNQTWIYDHIHEGMVKAENEHYFEDCKEQSEDGAEKSEDGEEHCEDGEHLIDIEEYCLIYLSHWMVGPNEMKVGDHITITVADRFINLFVHIKECGIGLVYDSDGKNEEEDVLGYYKSWNHIVGGDLSRFQLTTGEYILDFGEFNQDSSNKLWSYARLINDGIKFKEDKRGFRAFSQKKKRSLV